MKRFSLLIIQISLLMTFTLTLLSQEKKRPDAGIANGFKSDAKNITFRFNNASLMTIIKFLAKLDGKIVIASKELKDKVNIKSPEKLNLDGAYKVLMAILETKGMSLIREKKFLKIIDNSGSGQKPLPIYFGSDATDVPSIDSMIIQIIPLRYIEARGLQQSIRSMISTNGSSFVNKDTNHLVVTDIGKNIQKILNIIKYLDVVKDVDPVYFTKVYDLNFLKTKEATKVIKDTLTFESKDKSKKETSRFKIISVESTNDIVVYGNAWIHKHVENIIKRLDVRKKQVLIVTKIVEVSSSDDLDVGLELQKFVYADKLFGKNPTHTFSTDGAPAQQFLNYTFDTGRLDFALKAIAKNSDVNLLSSPRLVTNNHQLAKIIVGQETPILKSVTDTSADSSNGKTVSDFTYKDVGIELEVTPDINDDKDVTMKIKFKITNILENVSFPGGVNAPKIGKREASTNVIVNTGQTLVIGGLIKNNVLTSDRKVPILSKIPLIGNAFKRKAHKREKTELLVFITPYVISNKKEAEMFTEKEMKGVQGKLQLSGNGSDLKIDILKRAWWERFVYDKHPEKTRAELDEDKEKWEKKYLKYQKKLASDKLKADKKRKKADDKRRKKKNKKK